MNFAKSWGTTILIVAICAAAIEILFRFFVLPQNFLYIESSYTSTPRHRLVQHYDAAGIRIEDRRWQDTAPNRVQDLRLHEHRAR